MNAFDAAESVLANAGDEDPTTFGEKVCAIIRDYLLARPGTGKDRVCDEVVSRMVRACIWPTRTSLREDGLVEVVVLA